MGMFGDASLQAESKWRYRGVTVTHIWREKGYREGEIARLGKDEEEI